MIYTCPDCGELKNEDIIAQCRKCGSNEVEEQGDSFFCPNCDGVKESHMVLFCAICGNDLGGLA
ncbi:MAG: hypothetical protein U9P90_02455 [Patescibacteria group bacterium]|nr:hypothetical protein [Patescibacteria group bacterium]